MIEQYINKNDIRTILIEMVQNLPAHKYDVGRKVISELCSKLAEQITALYYSKKLGIDVVAGKHDVDPDVLFKFTNDPIPLEIKVAMGSKVCKWRGGGLTDRSCDYLFISRSRDCKEFFVAICHTTKSDWLLQKTKYFAPYVTEEILSNKNSTVLWGNFSTEAKGRRKGKTTIVMEKI